MNRLRGFSKSSFSSQLWRASSTSTPSFYSSAYTPVRSSSLWYARSYSADAHGHGATSPEVVSARVVQVVKNFHKIGENTTVTEKSHFANDLGLDSLDTVELVLALEDEFCIEIQESDADKIQSTADAIQYLLTNPHIK